MKPSVKKKKRKKKISPIVVQVTASKVDSEQKDVKSTSVMTPVWKISEEKKKALFASTQLISNRELTEKQDEYEQHLETRKQTKNNDSLQTVVDSTPDFKFDFPVDEKAPIDTTEQPSLTVPSENDQTAARNVIDSTSPVDSRFDFAFDDVPVDTVKQPPLPVSSENNQISTENLLDFISFSFSDEKNSKAAETAASVFAVDSKSDSDLVSHVNNIKSAPVSVIDKQYDQIVVDSLDDITAELDNISETADEEMTSMRHCLTQTFLKTEGNKSTENFAEYLKSKLDDGLEAARKLYSETCIKLENAYFHGIEDKAKDLKQAFSWLKKRASLGDPEALFDIGMVHYTGKYGIQNEQQLEVERNLKLAAFFFEQAENKFGKNPIFNCADELKESIVIHLVKSLEITGNLSYQGSNGVETNLDEAIIHLTKAAEKGGVDSCYILWEIYSTKEYKKKDLPTAVSWYEKAHDRGCKKTTPQQLASNFYQLGLSFSNGKNGVVKSDFDAIMSFERAAKLFNVDASFSLSIIYFKDGLTRGVEYLEKAKKLGSHDAILFESGKLQKTDFFSKNDLSKAFKNYKSITLLKDTPKIEPIKKSLPALKASALKPKPKKSNDEKQLAHLQRQKVAEELKRKHEKDEKDRAAALEFQQKQNDKGSALRLIAHNHRLRSSKTVPVTCLTQQPAPVAQQTNLPVNNLSTVVPKAPALSVDDKSSAELNLIRTVCVATTSTATTRSLSEDLSLDDEKKTGLSLTSKRDFYLKNDYVSPIAVLTKEPEYNDAQACFNWSAIYQVGDGIEQDLKLSADWCEKAANLNHPQAQFAYSNMLYWGRGVKQDAEKSHVWLEKACQAADKDLLDTLYGVARSFQAVEKTPINITYVSRLYACAAKNGHVLSQNQLDLMSLNNSEATEEKKLWLIESKQAKVNFAIKLPKRFKLFGMGIANLVTPPVFINVKQKTVPKLLEPIHVAQAVSQSFVTVNTVHQPVQEVFYDKEEIVTQLQSRADGHDPSAYFELSEVYRFGFYGMPKNMDFTIELLDRAFYLADKKLLEAVYQSALNQLNKDQVYADQLLKFAAEKGHLPAQFYLYLIAPGVLNKDNKWLKAAASRGYPPAKAEVARLGRVVKTDPKRQYDQKNSKFIHRSAQINEMFDFEINQYKPEELDSTILRNISQKINEFFFPTNILSHDQVVECVNLKIRFIKYFVQLKDPALAALYCESALSLLMVSPQICRQGSHGVNDVYFDPIFPPQYQALIKNIYAGLSNYYEYIQKIAQSAKMKVQQRPDLLHAAYFQLLQSQMSGESKQTTETAIQKLEQCKIAFTEARDFCMQEETFLAFCRFNEAYDHFKGINFKLIDFKDSLRWLCDFLVLSKSLMTFAEKKHQLDQSGFFKEVYEKADAMNVAGFFLLSALIKNRFSMCAIINKHLKENDWKILFPGLMFASDQLDYTNTQSSPHFFSHPNNYANNHQNNHVDYKHSARPSVNRSSMPT